MNSQPQRRGDAEMDLTKINSLSEKVIGAAIEVHRHLGPGLLEVTYETALATELELSGIPFQRQAAFPIHYKGHAIGEYRVDLLVGDDLLVELKSVERLDSLFEAQVLAYLRVTRRAVGLLINFNTRLLKDGIKRFVLTSTPRLCASAANSSP